MGFYQLIWEYRQKGMFILTTALLYVPKTPEISSRLTITRSPNDFLLPGVVEWGTSIGERQNKQKPP